MGAPSSRMQAVDHPSAEGLLTAFKAIDPAERQRHAHVLSYWLSIRGDKEFPPLHDLDPLEISDAGPSSVLLELISGGHDAEIRHLGEALRDEGWPEQIMDAADPSVLASIAKKLPIVAISRDFLAFEDEYTNAAGTTRCWVTLLPLSGGGAWVDYVYALVTSEVVEAKAVKAAEKPAKKAETKQPEGEPVEERVVEETIVEDIVAEEPVAEQPAAEDPVAENSVAEEAAVEEPAVEEPAVEETVAVEPVADEETGALELVDEVEPEKAQHEPQAEESLAEAEQTEEQPVAAAVAKAAPGFSKLFDSLAGLTGFYAQGVKVEPVVPADEKRAKKAKAEEPVAEEAVAEESRVEAKAEEPQKAEAVPENEPAQAQVDETPAKSQPKQPTRASEGVLQTKLQEVRAKADEARQARLRANAALYEGLSAAYDFALDAEDSPEEYLRLVEAKGLKIQLRSPMTPVVKLAFDGLCDDNAIAQLEAVLAWALSEDLPRGSLAERIEDAGGIAHILNGGTAAN